MVVIGFVITAEVLNASTVAAGIDPESIFDSVITCPDIAQVDELDMVVTSETVHEEDVSTI